MPKLILISILAFGSITFVNDACGDHKEVTFESQTVKVVTEDGTLLPMLPAVASTGTSEAFWGGENWYFKHSPMAVPLTFDAGTYATQEVKLKGKNRWKGLRFCRDTIHDLTVYVNNGPRESGVDIRYFANLFNTQLFRYKEDKVVVPSPASPHVITLKKRQVVEGKILTKIPANEKLDNHHSEYKMQISDGTNALLNIRTEEYTSETNTLEKAYNEGLPVRIYGSRSYYEGWDITIVNSDYVDIIQ